MTRVPVPVPVLVGVGGACGALLRHALADVLPGLSLPTLAANLLGCLLLGLLVGARPDDPVLRPLLGTGLLGGFTTFSGLALSTDLLLLDAPVLAAALLAANLVGGLLLTALGLRLGRRRS